MDWDDIKEYFVYAFKNLTHRKVRSWLTVLGIFIGIATIVALVSLGQGLQNTINEQFEILGTDKVMVYSGTSLFTAMSESAKPLTDDDLDVVKKTKGIDNAMGMAFEMGKVSYKDEINYMMVYSMPTDESRKIMEEISGFDLEEGRDFKSGDKYKVLLGNYFIQKGKIFDNVVRPGKKIVINGVEFDVVGVYEPVGNAADDSNVLIPLDTFRDLFDSGDEIGAVFARTIPGVNTEEVAEEVEENLRQYHNIEEGDEHFFVQTSTEMMESFNDIFNIVNIVLIGLAIISLVVGGIGIMNTMFTSVLQRTQEIGIMKAVGAQNSDILMIFLIESGLLGVGGGIIGIVLGLGISFLVSYIVEIALGTPYLQAFVSVPLIVGALLFSFLVGTISGILPAIRASKMNPVDAIQYKK